jgi:lipoyl(octanoyl) transferase 2
MKLRHLRFPSPVPYSRAAALQDTIVSRFLASKASASTSSATSAVPPPSPPSPTVITAQFNPVYTCGRREIGTVSPEQQNYLRAGGRAEFVEALRGGQTTFHGPGQLVAYPIIDLKRHGISPRDYVCKLEQSVIETLQLFGVRGFRTKDPGVWVSEDEKIASVGVHMRRYVSSHGVAVNVKTDLWWFDRIVACGLEGKRAVSLASLGHHVKFEDVERELVSRLAGNMGCHGFITENVDELEIEKS